MIWKSLGLLFDVQSKYEWMNSHAALPTVIKISNEYFRIFFSTRDTSNRSHATFVDLNFQHWNPGKKIIHTQKKPTFSPGKIGFFDDCGVTVSTFLTTKSGMYAYYLGWAQKSTTPFSNEIGIAAVDKNYNFSRIQNLPIYGRTEEEPLTFGYPTILKFNNKISMYYDGIKEWNPQNPSMYKFNLREAILNKKNKWIYSNKELIKLKSNERAITRPAFMILGKKLIMIYSLDVAGKYEFAAACKNKEGKWIRLRNFTFINSGYEWDSIDNCYPSIFESNNEFYMLYNGNGYGKSGFGIAKLLDY
jgi:hypothetical protein